MIIAFYIPEELAESYRKERFQPTLAKLKKWARQAGTPTDIKDADFHGDDITLHYYVNIEEDK